MKSGEWRVKSGDVVVTASGSEFKKTLVTGLFALLNLIIVFVGY